MLADTRRRYPTFERLGTAYSASLQGLLLSSPEKAYSDKSPAIGDLGRMYHAEAPALWVETQLQTLDFASQTKESADQSALTEFSTLFAAQYPGIKLTEFLLFIARFKLGRYGKFYGYFDTLTVGEAFRKFLRERADELAAIERDRATEAYLKSRELPEGYTVPEGYNPYTWYQERVRRGEIQSFGNLKHLRQ